MNKFGSLKKLRDWLPKLNQANRGRAGLLQIPQNHGISEGRNQDPVYIDASSIGTFMKKYDTILLDCDGVLWHTDHVTQFSGVSEAIAKLRSHNKRLLFVSNNSMHSRDSYSGKFSKFGGFDVSKEDIFTVSHAAALYLKHKLKVTKKCYLIGGRGVAHELDELGIEHIGVGPDQDQVSGDPIELLKQQLDPEVQAVLVAFDIHFGYNKLYKAASYLTNDACHYVVTNTAEGSCRIGPNNMQPLTAPMVQAVSVASRRQPECVGKPNKHMMECILTEFPDIKLERTVMIGDSLRTDIPFAKAAGIDSVLVLTGASSLADVARMQASPSPNSQHSLPDYILDRFSNLRDFL